MSSTELVGGKSSLEQNSACLNEQAEACKAFTNERVHLNGTIDTSFLTLPEHAQDYLRDKCKTPTHLTLAAREAAKLVATDPTILDDPDFAEFELDTCVESTEIAAKTAQREENAEIIEAQKADEELDNQKIEELDTTYIVVTKLQKDHAGKSGRAYLEAIRADVMANKPVPNRPKKPDEPELVQLSNKEQADLLVELDAVSATLDEMSAVFADNPAASAAFAQIVASAQFDLTADSMEGVFAPVMAQIDTNAVFTKTDKMRLERIVTGSQAQQTLRQTMVDENGQTIPSWPEDKPLAIRSGVDMYADGNNNQYLKIEYNGHITTIETTGWSGELVGKYLEALAWVRELESFGSTGLLQDIAQIDFNLTGEEGFNAHKIDQILIFMGKMFGGLDHADGDVEVEGKRRGMTRYLARLLSKAGTATGFEESQTDTDEVVKELQLRNPDGSQNWKQVEKLGQFVQRTYLNGDASYADLKADLVGESEPV